jgi:hypothetical protein
MHTNHYAVATLIRLRNEELRRGVSRSRRARALGRNT